MNIDLRNITDPADMACAEIAALWTHYIDHSIVTFNPVPKNAADIGHAITQKNSAGDPMIAAYRGEQFLGFATYGPFRNGAGYKFSKEHTIMLNDQAKGSGLGRRLMTALETRATQQNIQSLWAGIAGENTATIDFHTRLGFQHIATIDQIGWKFDRWHDLVLMRKRLR